MNPLLQSILSALGTGFPMLASMIPLPAIATNAIGAMGKQLINDALATPQQVHDAIVANPAAAQAALQPLEDHLATANAAAVAGAVQVTPAEMPHATASVNDAIVFATDTREVSLGEVDSSGRAILRIYLTVEQYAQLRMSA